MAVTSTMRTQITQLYVALFGRAPEADGFAYWVGMLESGKTFTQVAQAMYDAPAAKAVYPAFLLNSEVVTKFYTNVLGRQPDQAGLDYWTAQLNTKTKGQVIADMVNAVTTYAGTDAAALDSKAFFNAKVDAGLTYVLAGGNDPANKVIDAIVPQAPLTAAVDAAAKATADAATATTTANAAAATAAAAVDTTAAAAATAKTKADATDAAALKATSDAAATTAANAVTTATAKAADVTAAQKALNDAIATGVVNDINTANAKLLIAQSAKTTADAAVTSTAAAATTAKAAADAAAADDAAAATAATAAASAVTAAATAADAAVKAAAAQTTAAAAQAAAAAKTSATADDTAAAAAVKAAADATAAAASAKATTEVLALATAYATAKAAADTAAATAAAAKTAAASAITGTTSAALAQAAITAATAEQTAAAASKVAADAAKVAADAYAASAAKTSVTTDDTAAAAAVTAAAALVTGAASAVTAAAADVAAANLLPAKYVAQNGTLTNLPDTFVGGAGNDTVTGILGDQATSGNTNTYTALDNLDGGAGAGDTLTLNQVDIGTRPSGVQVKGFEILNVKSAVSGQTFDTTSASGGTSLGAFTGLTNSNFTLANGGTVIVGTGEAVSVTNFGSNAASVTGGTTQTVSASLGDVTASGASGAVSVTHTGLAGGTISVQKGAAVTVNASGVTNAGAINVGTTTLPTGDIVINSTGKAYDASLVATDTLSDITVKGGTSITVNQTAYANKDAAATDTAVFGRIQSKVVADAKGTATSVTVTQSAAVSNKDFIQAVTPVKATQEVTFKALAATETITVEGLKFTAAKALTAEEVAAAFANLAASSTLVQGSSAASNGIYNGTYSGNFSTAAASGAKVIFTSKTAANGAATAVSFAGTGTVAQTPTTGGTIVTGVANTTGQAARPGITGGQVQISDTGATAKLANVTLNAYGASSTVSSSALQKLDLSNSTKDLAVTTTATTLGVTLSAVGSSSSSATLDFTNASSVTALNLTTGASGSYVIAKLAAVKTLAVTGTSVADLSKGAATQAALETVTVAAGGAGVKLATDAAANLKTIDAGAATGTIKASVDGTKATVTTGSGDDSITVTSTTIAKAITLGAGDDYLNLATGTTASSVTLDGGTGFDTISLDFADAASLTLTSTFATKVANFESLQIQDAVTADATVNMENLNNLNYLVTNGVSTAGKTLTFDKVANAGTLELDDASNATGVTKVVLKDATGTADSFDIVTYAYDSAINYGVVDIGGVESLKLTANYIDNDFDPTTVGTHTIDIKDAALKTLTIAGSAPVTLTTNSSNVALTLIDGSSMTTKLTAATVSAATAGATIKGGSASDSLTANHDNDSLVGGAGNDTLTVASGAKAVALSGGAGNDTFVFSGPAGNTAGYAVISDLGAGDVLKFPAAVNFKAAAAAAVDPANATFQNYADAAVAAAGADGLAWFQYAGNTYVINNVGVATTTFDAVTDIAVKITGLVDLSKSSMSDSSHTALIIV